MKLPRDLSARKLIKILSRFGYEPSRQTGSHVRVTRPGPPRHSVTVPMKSPIRVGTLERILKKVADNLGVSIEDILAD